MYKEGGGQGSAQRPGITGYGAQARGDPVHHVLDHLVQIPRTATGGLVFPRQTCEGATQTLKDVVQQACLHDLILLSVLLCYAPGPGGGCASAMRTLSLASKQPMLCRLTGIVRYCGQDGSADQHLTPLTPGADPIKGYPPAPYAPGVCGGVRPGDREIAQRLRGHTLPCTLSAPASAAVQFVRCNTLGRAWRPWTQEGDPQR